ncbi:MAG: hypothetical protein ACYC46_03635 [Acidobacteriaceae bacterium]
MKSFKSVVAIAVLATASALTLQAQVHNTSVQHVMTSEPVQFELVSKLDTKSAKVGEPVIAKLLESVTYDGNKISRGAKLLGKVTDVKPGVASLSINFETIEIKKDTPQPVHGVIVAVAPRPSLSDSGLSAHDLPQRGTAGQASAMTGMSMSESSDALPPLAPGSSIKGITLTSGNTVSLSGTFTSKSKNFKLDKGSRMAVGLWTVGSMK